MFDECNYNVQIFNERLKRYLYAIFIYSLLPLAVNAQIKFFDGR